MAFILTPPVYLIFPDDDGEVFQVRKSSHSKKVMRMMDKERRRKKKEERSAESGSGHHSQTYDNSSLNTSTNRENGSRLNNDSHNLGSSASQTASSSSEHIKKSNKSDSIQTEIRTDDFVVRLLLSFFTYHYTKKNQTKDIRKTKLCCLNKLYFATAPTRSSEKVWFINPLALE